MADTLDVLTLTEGYRAINDSASATAGTGSHDTQLAQFITGISRVVDDMCGPVVNRTITSELHDGDGGCHLGCSRRRIWLQQTPASSVTTVTEYRSTTSTSLSAESNASKPSDGYLLISRTHYVAIHRRTSNADTTFPSGRQNVDVAYVAGRAANTAAVDEQFKVAAAEALRSVWKRASNAWSQSPGFLADVESPEQAIEPFRKPVRQAIRDLLSSELRPEYTGRGILVG